MLDVTNAVPIAEIGTHPTDEELKARGATKLKIHRALKRARDRQRVYQEGFSDGHDNAMATRTRQKDPTAALLKMARKAMKDHNADSPRSAWGAIDRITAWLFRIGIVIAALIAALAFQGCGSTEKSYLDADQATRDFLVPDLEREDGTIAPGIKTLILETDRLRPEEKTARLDSIDLWGLRIKSHRQDE